MIINLIFKREKEILSTNEVSVVLLKMCGNFDQNSSGDGGDKKERQSL
jgi:hypothetical protein